MHFPYPEYKAQFQPSGFNFSDTDDDDDMNVVEMKENAIVMENVAFEHDDLKWLTKPLKTWRFDDNEIDKETGLPVVHHFIALAADAKSFKVSTSPYKEATFVGFKNLQLDDKFLQLSS